jgi:hypothetical protein
MPPAAEVEIEPFYDASMLLCYQVHCLTQQCLVGILDSGFCLYDVTHARSFLLRLRSLTTLHQVALSRVPYLSLFVKLKI